MNTTLVNKQFSLDQLAQAQLNTLIDQRTGWMNQYPVTTNSQFFPVKMTTAKTALCACGYCRTDYNMEFDMMNVHQTAYCWLTERVDRVRQRGREWLTGKPRVKRVDALEIVKNKNAPPPVRGDEPDWEYKKAYTKQLRNGDQVWVYPEDSEFVQNARKAEEYGLIGSYYEWASNAY